VPVENGCKNCRHDESLSHDNHGIHETSSIDIPKAVAASSSNNVDMNLNLDIFTFKLQAIRGHFDILRNDTTKHML
jgi:hypothetical protein